MGGDSASVSNGYDLTVTRNPKVFKLGDLLIGVAGSRRWLDLLRSWLDLPTPETDEDGLRYMLRVANGMCDLASEYGRFSKKEPEEIEAGTLVGCHGRLFYIDGHFAVLEPADGFMAMGSGDQVAHGVLYAYKQTVRSPLPTEAVGLALQAAERFSAGVRGPFVIEVV